MADSPHSEGAPTLSVPFEFPEELKHAGWPEENLALSIKEEGGFYPAFLGEIFEDGRFVITRKLGWGTSSSVWLARDRRDKRHVSMKILSAFATQVVSKERLTEGEKLKKVTETNPGHLGYEHVAHLFHEFKFDSYLGEHICYVSDVLSYSVSSLKKQMHADPRLPVRFTLKIVKDVLKGLDYLHNECGLIHTDLQPGNILVRPGNVDKAVMHELADLPSTLYNFPKHFTPFEYPFRPVRSAPLVFDTDRTATSFKFHWVISDLGVARQRKAKNEGVVQPYALRAPEVILGLSWGPAIDIWSLGCLMYEFVTSRWMFSPEAHEGLSREDVHLIQMMQRTGQDFDEQILQEYMNKTGRDGIDLLKLKNEQSHTKGLTAVEDDLNTDTLRYEDAESIPEFVRIMRSFLAFDPSKRPSATEALNDPILEKL